MGAWVCVRKRGKCAKIDNFIATLSWKWLLKSCCILKSYILAKAILTHLSLFVLGLTYSHSFTRSRLCHICFHSHSLFPTLYASTWWKVAKLCKEEEEAIAAKWLIYTKGTKCAPSQMVEKKRICSSVRVYVRIEEYWRKSRKLQSKAYAFQFHLHTATTWP